MSFVWTHSTKSRVEAGAAVLDDRLLIGSCDGTLHCLALDTGKPLWSFATDADGTGRAFIYATPIVAGSRIYFAAMEGQIYALDSETGG